MLCQIRMKTKKLGISLYEKKVIPTVSRIFREQDNSVYRMEVPSETHVNEPHTEQGSGLCPASVLPFVGWKESESAR